MAAVALAAAAAPALAQRPMIYEGHPAERPEKSKDPWVEIEVDLPAYPAAADLIEFNTAVAQRSHAYIDRRSLYVGEDGIVRYAMIVRPNGGIDNITFEGIRCDTREYKIYAVGDANAWVRVPSPRWAPVEYKEINNQRKYLWREIFCPASGMVKSTAEAVDALKRGINRRQDPAFR
jgi:CNP1-like family